MTGDRSVVRVVALGNPDRGDDGAAILAARELGEDAETILAGRPGADLLELLTPERPCILVDVTVSGSPPGTLHQVPLEKLSPDILPDLRLSTHGFGPGEALALARTLGRPLPRGVFLGIEGESFHLGADLSPAVEAGLPRLESRIRQALEELGKVEHEPATGRSRRSLDPSPG